MKWEIDTDTYTAADVAVKSLQSCPTLCDPIDGSPPGSSVHGIFQARGLEWGAIAFSGYIHYYVWNRQLMRTNWMAQGTLLSVLWWPKWEGISKRGDMFMHSYGWPTLPYSRSWLRSINQLCVCCSVMSDSLWLHRL